MEEKELKVLLTNDQYLRLRNKFESKLIYNQINFYYSDENQIIKKKDITVRVREKEGKVSLQVKIPCGEQGLIHRKNEFQKTIDAIPMTIDGKILSEITALSLPDVSMKGYLITERRITKWGRHTEICLDRNQYLGIVDYELEVEYNDKIPGEIFSVLENERISLVETKGKCSRFFEQFERRRNGQTN